MTERISIAKFCNAIKTIYKIAEVTKEEEEQ